MKKILFLAAFMFGCAHTPTIVSVEYEFSDNINEKNIEIVFHNTYPHPVCLTPEMWPNASGRIDAAGDFVYLTIDGVRYPMKNFNTGYCPGCSTRVSVGETIRGVIPYKHFELPEKLHGDKKDIHFSPVAEICQ
jgi:hypothetical protein